VARLEWVKGFTRRAGAAAAAAACLALLCYTNTCGNRFVFDDLDIITHNPLVTGPGLDMAGIFTSHYWQHLTPEGDLYRPLVITSYALNHRIGGLDPAGYHAVNIALHALCAALVVWLGIRLGFSIAASLAAGLLFAAHPIHTEAVAGLVGRAELMSAVAILAGWAVHLGKRAPPAGRIAATAALLAAGLLSKENAIVLPGLMLLGDLWRVRRGETSWRRVAPAYVVCGAVIAVWLAARALLLAPYPPGSIYEGPFTSVPAADRIHTALGVMGRYLWILVSPINLSADYSFEQIPIFTSWSDPPALISATLLLLVTIIAIRRLAAGASPRADGLCLLIFLVTVAPVSNLLMPIGTIMGERLLYLPSVGFCLLLPALWSSIRRAGPAALGARGLGAALACVLAGLYSVRTIERNRDWKDQITLFSVTAVTSPRSAKVHYNLGVALEEAGRPDEALKEYLAATTIKPFDAKAHHNAGLLLAAAERTAEASFHLDQASRLDPDLPRVFTSLGAALSRLGKDEQAEAAFRAALKHDPGDHAALYNLGTLHIMKGKPADAIPLLEKARDLDPSEPDGRYQLGLAYLLGGRPADAIPELNAALDLSPTLADAHLQLALAYLRLGDRQRSASEAALARNRGIELPGELMELAPPRPDTVR
jgi:tetratricopeptide (TPR) repeat protein